jgi:hypothetical protein
VKASLLFLTSGLFLSAVLQADSLVGSAGYGWQTWSTTTVGPPTVTLNNDGGQFWDNRSIDGSKCNIGFWLTGTATGCGSSTNPPSPASGLPSAEAPGAIPYWGNTAGLDDPNFFFNNSKGDTATLRLELSGNRNFNAFGYYDATGPHQLFSGPTDPVTVSPVFTPVGDFGYYFTDKNGSTFKTQSSLDSTLASKDQRFALFRQNPAGTSSGPPNIVNVYWLGVEDSTLGGPDHDFQDMVVRVSAVPEPAGYLALTLLLGIVLFSARRKLMGLGV